LLHPICTPTLVQEYGERRSNVGLLHLNKAARNWNRRPEALEVTDATSVPHPIWSSDIARSSLCVFGSLKKNLRSVAMTEHPLIECSVEMSRESPFPRVNHVREFHLQVTRNCPELNPKPSLVGLQHLFIFLLLVASFVKRTVLSRITCIRHI
jgi:hypothetical protein